MTTTWYDIVNACFEIVGGLLIWLNVAQLKRDRMLHGVRWEPQVVFTVWGAWNLFYYPMLGQWWSAVASASIVAANAVWLWMVWRFWQKRETSAMLYGAIPNNLWNLRLILLFNKRFSKKNPRARCKHGTILYGNRCRLCEKERDLVQEIEDATPLCEHGIKINTCVPCIPIYKSGDFKVETTWSRNHHCEHGRLHDEICGICDRLGKEGAA